MAVRSTDGRAVLFACPPLGVCRTAAGLEGRSWPLPACAMRWPQAAVLAAGPSTTLTAATLVTATLTAAAYADAAAHADHAFATSPSSREPLLRCAGREHVGLARRRRERQEGMRVVVGCWQARPRARGPSHAVLGVAVCAAVCVHGRLVQGSYIFSFVE